MSAERLLLSQKYKEFLACDAPVEFLEGTTAAGKTTVGIFKFMLKVAQSPKKIHILSGLDLGTIEKNIINKDLGILDDFGALAEYNAGGKGKYSLPHIVFHTSKGDKIIYVLGYDNKARWKKALGGQYGCVYIDEINIADMEYVREVSMRCDYLLATLTSYSQSSADTFAFVFTGITACEFTRDELTGYECEVFAFNLNGKMSLQEIIAHANKGGFDAILAPHLNAHTNFAYGTEAYYYPGDARGRAIADNICKELSVTLGIPQRSNGIDDGGDKASTYFGFVRQTKATAILLETCFISTDSEAKRIDEAHEQKAVGQAIARGIVKALGLRKKAVVPPTVKYGIVITAFCGVVFSKQKADEFVKVFWDGKKGNYCRALTNGNSHFVEMQAYLKKSDAHAKADALELLGWSATVKVM